MVPPALERVLSAGGPLRLNLGGAGEGFLSGRIEGFLTVDLREVSETDVISDVSDLSFFESQSVETIYASNVLEHFPIARTVDVLKEWKRVLKSGGHLYVSVPDFDVAVKLYQKAGLTEWLQYHLWGDQKHPLNYHYITFTLATLAKALIEAGFNDVKRVKRWPFEARDGSQNVDTQYGMLISLNVEVI